MNFNKNKESEKNKQTMGKIYKLNNFPAVKQYISFLPLMNQFIIYNLSYASIKQCCLMF